MLQSSAATVAHGKIPHRKRAPRASRRVETADEPDDDVLLVTFPEAARRLGLSRMTLHHMVVAGALGVRRFGRAVRIPTSELERLAKPGSTPTKPKRQQAAE